MRYYRSRKKLTIMPMMGIKKTISTIRQKIKMRAPIIVMIYFFRVSLQLSDDMGEDFFYLTMGYCFVV